MHRRFFASLVVLVAFATSALAQQPAYKIVATDYQRVNATITYQINMKEFAVSKWMVFLPEPPELPSQHGVKVIASPAGKVVTEASVLGRKVRYIEKIIPKPVAGRGLTLKLDIEATLRARKLVELSEGEKPPRVPPLTANERKYYLSPTTRVDFDKPAFREWLDAKKLHLEKMEHPLEFAARVLKVIRSDYTYHYDANEDKRASVACKNDRTDCAGMSYLFVGAMRANNIPARLIVGRQAYPRKEGSNPSQTEYDRPHVRVEMFISDIGWVPVDPAYAHGAKGIPVTAYIGNDSGDLLVLHIDVDMQLPFSDKIRESQFLQIGPNYWTQGNGRFDGSFGPTGWELKTTRIEK